MKAYVGRMCTANGKQHESAFCFGVFRKAPKGRPAQAPAGGHASAGAPSALWRRLPWSVWQHRRSFQRAQGLAGGWGRAKSDGRVCWACPRHNTHTGCSGVTRQRLSCAGSCRRAGGGRTLMSPRRVPGRRGTLGGTWGARRAAPTAAPSARPTATTPCSRTTSLRALMKVTTLYTGCMQKSGPVDEQVAPYCAKHQHA